MYSPSKPVYQPRSKNISAISFHGFPITVSGWMIIKGTRFDFRYNRRRVLPKRHGGADKGYTNFVSSIIGWRWRKKEDDGRKNRRSRWAVVTSIIFNTLPGYRWLFINSNPQVLPIHTNSARTVPRPVRTLMDAAPLRGSAPVQEPGGKGGTRT